MALLEIKHVSRAFDGVLAVDNVSFGIDEGETVSVIGPNGAGKTTLFNLITGVDQPTDGEIVFAGQSLTGLGTHQYRPPRDCAHLPARPCLRQPQCARQRADRRPQPPPGGAVPCAGA